MLVYFEGRFAWGTYLFYITRNVVAIGRSSRWHAFVAGNKMGKPGRGNLFENISETALLKKKICGST